MRILLVLVYKVKARYMCWNEQLDNNKIRKEPGRTCCSLPLSERRKELRCSSYVPEGTVLGSRKQEFKQNSQSCLFLWALLLTRRVEGTMLWSGSRQVTAQRWASIFRNLSSSFIVHLAIIRPVSASCSLWSHVTSFCLVCLWSCDLAAWTLLFCAGTELVFIYCRKDQIGRLIFFFSFSFEQGTGNTEGDKGKS